MGLVGFGACRDCISSGLFGSPGGSGHPFVLVAELRLQGADLITSRGELGLDGERLICLGGGLFGRSGLFSRAGLVLSQNCFSFSDPPWALLCSASNSPTRHWVSSARVVASGKITFKASDPLAKRISLARALLQSLGQTLVLSVVCSSSCLGGLPVGVCRAFELVGPLA